MKAKRKKKHGSAGIIQSVTAQSVKGQAFKIDENFGGNIADLQAVPPNPKEPPFRVIDDAPVFHAHQNQPDFEDDGFDVRKLHRWGRLEHPSVILGSYPIGGDVRFYVDTRLPDLYRLRTATRVDSDEFPGVSYDLVAWTPRRKGDSVKAAGFRLVHAAMMVMLLVGDDEWHCPAMFDDEEWEGTEEVAMIIGAIAPTIHKSGKDLARRLERLPAYLRPLYKAGASEGKEDCLYLC